MGDADRELPPGDPSPGDDFYLDAYSDWSLQEIAARSADPRFAPLEVIRLRTPRSARRWVLTAGQK